MFGLGRYFYDLPRTWVDLDNHNRHFHKYLVCPIGQNAEAICQERSARNEKPKPGSNGNGNRRNGLYRDELLAEIRRLSEQVGVGLSREVLRRFGGADEVERVRDVARLTMVMERMEDVGARGRAFEDRH